MENIIYEKDYSKERDERISKGKLEEAEKFHDILKKSGILKAYGDRMKQIPKVVVPEDKANYEYLLNRLDKLAQKLGGKIHGIVSYDDWDAHIYVDLPYFEATSDEQHQLLREINEKAHNVTFYGQENGGVHISIMINYFEEVMDDADSGAILEEEILKQPEMVAYLTEQRKKKRDLLFSVIKQYAAMSELLKKMSAEEGQTERAMLDTLMDELDVHNSDPVLFEQTLIALCGKYGVEYPIFTKEGQIDAP